MAWTITLEGLHWGVAVSAIPAVSNHMREYRREAVHYLKHVLPGVFNHLSRKAELVIAVACRPSSPSVFLARTVPLSGNFPTLRILINGASDFSCLGMRFKALSEVAHEQGLHPY